MTEVYLQLKSVIDAPIDLFIETVDQPFIELSNILGFPDDQIKLIFTFLMCIVIGQI